jgi:hypothetical protein
LGVDNSFLVSKPTKIMADAATTAGTTTTSTTTAPPFASLLEWVRHLVHHDEDDANSGCTGRKKRRRTAVGGRRAFLHPAIDIDATTRTVVTTQDIPAHTCVMKIPLILWVKEEEKSTSSSTSDDSRLALALLRARRNGTMLPYWETLPKSIRLPRDDNDEDDDIALLQGSPVLHHVRRERIQMRREYDALVEAEEIRTTTTTTTTTLASSASSSKNNHHNDNNQGQQQEQQDQQLQQQQYFSWDEYSYARAVVSSRAFALPEGVCGGTTLVPLLDLCNHARGQSLDGTSTKAKKNLSYTFVTHEEEEDDGDSGGAGDYINQRDQNNDDDETLPPEKKKRKMAAKSSSNNIYYVVVTAAVDIPRGEPLIITYGARSNAILLCQYGFCLPNNIEPDGSSNDTYEWQWTNDNNDDATTTTTSRSIFLRTGPKSYTYGPFVQVLAAYTARHHRRRNGGADNENDDGDNDAVGCTSTMNEYDDDDDMDAFLSEGKSDDHDDDDNDTMDALYGDKREEEGTAAVGDAFWSMEKPPSINGETITAVDDDEIRALQAFADECTIRLEAYRLKGDKLSQLLLQRDDDNTAAVVVRVHDNGDDDDDHGDNNSSSLSSASSSSSSMQQYRYYCALLIQSERRILQFYRHAAVAITAQLLQEQQERPPPLVQKSTTGTGDDDGDDVEIKKRSNDDDHDNNDHDNNDNSTASSFRGYHHTWKQVDAEDTSRLDRQVAELVQVYQRIRHPKRRRLRS